MNQVGSHTTPTEKRFTAVNHSKTFLRIKKHLVLHSKKTLDLGCSFGEYLVSFGEGSLGITTRTDEVAYGKEHGIRIVQGNVETLNYNELHETFDAIWANNLFEHLLAPHSFLMKLKQSANNETLLVLGVPVLPRFSSLTKIRKFRGALASAHINFFTKETLELTVARSGWTVQEIRPFIFSNKYLDALASIIAPHLYVVAHNDSNFKYDVKKYREWKDDEHYAELLVIGKGNESEGKL